VPENLEYIIKDIQVNFINNRITMKKIHFISIFFILTSFINSYSQTKIMGEKVDDSTTKLWGPNLRNYIHGYIGISFPLGKNSKNEFKHIASNKIILGARYKLKLNQTFAIGVDLSYVSERYKLTQNDKKTFPDIAIHKKQILYLNRLGGESYFRINFGRRGNRVGKYIDLGYLVGYNIIDRLKTKDNLQGNSFIKTNAYYNVFFNNYNQYFSCRLAFNNIILFYTYRIDDIFKSRYNQLLEEYPRNNFGIQIGMYK